MIKLLAALLMIPCIAVSQDKIVFNSGTVIFGNVLAYSNGQFDIRLNDFNEVKQARVDKIQHISFGDVSENSVPDFFFGFKHINEDGADNYIVDQRNMRKYSEWQNPPTTFWGPSQNDLNGFLTMRFDFPSPSKSIKISTRIEAWNFAVGGAISGGPGNGARGGRELVMVRQDSPRLVLSLFSRFPTRDFSCSFRDHQAAFLVAA